MQCVLSSTTEEIVHNLKQLALKAHEASPDTTNEFNSKKYVGPKNRYGVKTPNKGQLPSVLLHMFASMDRHQANLESKIHSGRVGAIATIIPQVNFGVSYNLHKTKGKEYHGLQLGNANGSVKATTETNSLSATIAFNPNKSGLTSHITSCYGWRKISNSRSFIHLGEEAKSTGKPDIYLTGGLIQAGYNIIVTKQLSFTPYVEYLISNVKWINYKESKSLFLCSISGNKEILIEKSIGFRSHCKFYNNSQLQTWITGILSHRTTNSLHCRPLIDPLGKYKVSIPHSKKCYIRTEIGNSYTVIVTDNLELFLTGIINVSQERKIERQHITLYMTYLY